MFYNMEVGYMHKGIQAALLVISFLPLAVFAHIHYWVDAKGVKHYSFSPPESKEGIRDYQVVETISEISATEPVNPSGNNTSASAASQAKTYPNVVVYSTSWCKYCKAAKTWLQQNQIPFQDYDVEKNPAALQEYDRLGGDGYPLIVVGEKKMTGWSESLMREYLGMK